MNTMNEQLTYTQQGDYLLPNLAMTATGQPIGKYGMLRKTYLQTQRKGLYASLMLSDELHSHLTEIDQTARAQVEQTIQKLLTAHPAPDKAADPIGWAGHLNNLKQQAEELVLTELIYN